MKLKLMPSISASRRATGTAAEPCLCPLPTIMIRGAKEHIEEGSISGFLLGHIPTRFIPVIIQTSNCLYAISRRLQASTCRSYPSLLVYLPSSCSPSPVHQGDTLPLYILWMAIDFDQHPDDSSAIIFVHVCYSTDGLESIVWMCLSKRAIVLYVVVSPDDIWDILIFQISPIVVYQEVFEVRMIPIMIGNTTDQSFVDVL